MPTQQQQSVRDWTAFSAPENDIETIDDFIKFKLEEYEEVGLMNDDLWETFKEDFDSFTETIFKSANQQFIRKLRTHLRKYGVWIKKERQTTVAQALAQTLLEEDMTPWTDTEIRECGEVFVSDRINYILKNPTPLRNTPPTVDTPESSDNPAEVDNPAKAKQPLEQQQQQGHGKELANLARLYTDDMKYSGENDNFDFKLTIFHDLCNRANILNEVKTTAFPTML